MASVTDLPIAVQKQLQPGDVAIGPQKGPQTKYLASRADCTIFGGAGGGGKSFGTLLYAAQYRQLDGFNAVIFRRTYKRIKMRGGLWDDSSKIFPLLGGEANQSELKWTFKGDSYTSTIQFAHLQHTSTMYDYKGLQAALICFEELTEFDEEQFFYLKSRNRSTCGIKPVMNATTNPDADSWVCRFLAPWVDDKWPDKDRSHTCDTRRFIREDDAIRWLPKNKTHKDATSVKFIISTLYDNKILMQLNPEYEKGLKSLPLVERRRLLEADWQIRRAGGKVFKKHWFKIVDHVPGELVRSARGWDLAATEEKDDSKKTGPDFTAGVKVGRLANGQFIILDARRARETPANVDTMVKNTADQDGKETEIYMEQEPGSSGVRTIAGFSILLAGYDFHGVRSTGSKVERARGASSLAENGNILILRGSWNEAFLNELEAFPDPRVHDDFTDGFTLATSQLLEKQKKGGMAMDASNEEIIDPDDMTDVDRKYAAFL